MRQYAIVTSLGVLLLLGAGIFFLVYSQIETEPGSDRMKPEQIPADVSEVQKGALIKPNGLQNEIPRKINSFIQAARVGQIESISPYDFDDDGQEEYLVAERIPGSAGALYWYVVFIKNEIIKRTEPDSMYRTIEAGRLRGNNSIVITKEGLIKEISPVYISGDPNAAPSGGRLISYFTFVNGKIQLVRQEVLGKK